MCEARFGTGPRADAAVDGFHVEGLHVTFVLTHGGVEVVRVFQLEAEMRGAGLLQLDGTEG